MDFTLGCGRVLLDIIHSSRGAGIDKEGGGLSVGCLGVSCQTRELLLDEDQVKCYAVGRSSSCRLCPPLRPKV